MRWSGEGGGEGVRKGVLLGGVLEWVFWREMGGGSLP